MQHSELFFDERSVVDLQIFESKNFVHLFWYIRGGLIFKNDVQKPLVPLDIFSSNFLSDLVEQLKCNVQKPLTPFKYFLADSSTFYVRGVRIPQSI